MTQLRKIYCEERLKKGFDKLSIKELRELTGFIIPSITYKATKKIIKFEVTTHIEKDFYTANSRFEAELIANQEMIIGLLLKSQKKR